MNLVVCDQILEQALHLPRTKRQCRSCRAVFRRVEGGVIDEFIGASDLCTVCHFVHYPDRWAPHLLAELSAPGERLLLAAPV